MPKTQNRAVMRWIIAFASFAVFLVIFGGYVRLTRSGLSIVEWNPVSGVMPPLNQQAWQTEYSKYQRTPEFQKVNFNLTLDQFKEIYIIEWLHRIFARLAGLIFAIPFIYFVFKKIIPWNEVGLYAVMGILFLAQAVMGWLMVSSGLVDQPAVSQYLLTVHLFLALSLIGFALWTAFGHLYGFPNNRVNSSWSAASKAALAALLILLMQTAYGGFTAGLKAGLVSDTWPLMFGRLIPGGLLQQVQPAMLNLLNAPLTVAFIHRWLAFVVMLAIVALFWTIHIPGRRTNLHTAVQLLLTLVLVQIALGILVITSHVQIAIALLHQANAVALFVTLVYLLHRLRATD